MIEQQNTQGGPAAELRALAEQVQALRAEVRFLHDRQAIADVMVRYTHALDRHDWDALCNEVFHPDAVCDYGFIVGDPPHLCRRLEPIYQQDYELHSHFIGNHHSQVDGDSAQAQTYCTTFSLLKGGQGIRSLYIRYLDRLERRDGVWKIALRRMLLDARSEIPASAAPDRENRWDRSDPAYQQAQLPRGRMALWNC